MWVAVLAALGGAVVCGCDNGASGRPWSTDPLNLLLPRLIRIHAFTKTRTFDEAGGLKGVDVRIEAKDAYDEATKAFGKFRFELYTIQPHDPDPKRNQVMTWEEDLTSPKKNRLHWHRDHHMYIFKLIWDRPIPAGQEFVLRAVFTSPYTKRLIDERTFVSGQ